MKAIIISGGHIDDAFALTWLHENKYDLLIVADSGMEFLFRNKIMPDVIAGDFDSVGDEAYEYFVGTGAEDASCEGVRIKGKKTEILRLNPMKDDTDTEFVIREAIRRGATSITILGGTGTRLDHVMGNVHLLGIGLQENISIELIDKHNRVRMISSELVLERENQFGDFVSILPFAGAAKGVTLKGFKYPLENAVVQSFSSLGISNEIVEDEAVVQVQDGVLLVIEARD